MATGIALNMPRTQPSLPRLYFNEVRFELLKLSRNRSYLFSMIGFPVVFYLLFGVTNKDSMFHGHTIARYLLAGYSCFGAMGSSLFGIGAGLALERGHDPVDGSGNRLRRRSDQHGRRSSIAVGDCCRGFALCQPGIDHRLADALQRSAGSYQPDLSSNVVLRGPVDAD